MSAEPEVKLSPLSQQISSDGKVVQVDIYADDTGGWILEVIDGFNNSTVWDEPFESESAALAEAKAAIAAEGVASFIGPASGKGEW